MLFDRAYGVLRSLLIYYAWPGRLAKTRAFYGALIGAGDLCFDIGAHVGNRSYVWSRLGAQVVALEPQPDFARFCRWLFKGKSVEVVEAAAGAAPGVLELQISRRHPTVSTMSGKFLKSVDGAASFEQVRWDDSVEVEVLTLDQLIRRFGKPAFVKIDVEGFEPDVLAGLSEPVAALSFEYLAETIPIATACVDRLEELGRYRYNVSASEDMTYLFERWMDAAEIRAWLEARPANSGSGDVYARLEA
jgi:FkbM family methyltransferase